MILSLKKNKKITYLIQQTNWVYLILLMIVGFSRTYAAGYDVNKFSSLARQRYGEEAYQTVQELNQLLNQLKSASELEKLRRINDFFNQKIKFSDDIDVWGQNDYWATPLETIGKHAGDCEDFTIAKFTFLKVLHVSNDRLRLTYVKAEITNENGTFSRPHMVLSYYATPQAEPLILDNLKPNILPASSRNDLFPIYGFNNNGLWVGSSNDRKGDAQSHLSRWRDVLYRIQLDGIE